MDPSLSSLFSIQGGFVNLKNYQNEFETMRLLFDKMPNNVRSFCAKMSFQWLQTQEENENIEFAMKTDKEKLKESNNLRKEGNQLYTAGGDQRNVLGACRLYNDAIFAALDCEDSDEVALGFANRAMALQTFGYYRQAYDDCAYALEYGYPMAMRHKIVARQACCALQLKDANAMERHLDDLEKLTLNENFKKQLMKLRGDLATLKSSITDNDISKPDEIALNRESQEIIDSSSEKGHYMQAKYTIPKNNLIFTERAPSFVPINDQRRLCHQCCITNFIPYPCRRCRGRVVYCSLKCQLEHRIVHSYECAGYHFQLFAHVGIAHLALRMILDNGIFSIADRLEATQNMDALWSLFSEGGQIWTNKELSYAESLRMISHLDKMSTADIVWFALVSYLIVVYLKNYTKFFEELQEKNPHFKDWELLVSSLLLRHIGQLAANAHMLTTIVHKPLLFTSTDYHLLHDEVWASPLHLKSGYLHTYSHYTAVAVLNLPYLSLCNHSCVQSFQPRFSGRYISTFALRDLKQGDEITNCYEIDYRKAKRSFRRERLQSTYHFDCQCENCIQPEEDKDFNQYHQYRCDNRDCRQIFVPHIADRPSLEWWQKTETDQTDDVTIYCTKCGCEQRFEWYHELKMLCKNVRQVKTRRRMYQLFKSLENTLLGLNDARSYVSSLLCSEWFTLPYLGIPLNDEDYQDISDMVQYMLKCTKSQSCANSVEYVVDMTYLWDMIAIGKYKYSKAEMDEMLFALSITSDDLKVIFLNYYNDYIRDKS